MENEIKRKLSQQRDSYTKKNILRAISTKLKELSQLKQEYHKKEIKVINFYNTIMLSKFKTQLNSFNQLQMVDGSNQKRYIDKANNIR